MTADDEARTSVLIRLSRWSTALDERVFTSPLAPVIAVALLAIGAAAAVGALLDDPDYWLLAAASWFIAVLFFWSARTVRVAVRLRAAISRPDPIAEGILDFYFADDKTLASIAVQRDVSLGPVRRERTRRWSLKGGANKGVAVSGERGGEDTEVYELPGDVSTVLRELTKRLRDTGELETDLADIPTVEVDENA